MSTEKLIQKEDSFCSYPFTQMLLQPTGVVSPCCFNQEIVLGKVPEQNIEEIWNGEPIKKLRREFIEGKPVSCRTQMRHIRCHLSSRRPALENGLLRDEVQPEAPKRLDVRLNGKCNLQCIMCDVWKQPNGIYNASDFWARGAKDIFPNLREIDVLGGEPFVQGDTYRLIDEIWAINPECSWAFVTNGHYNLGETITARLDKIPIRWMQISLDSVDTETYAAVRRGGTLSRTLRTIDNLLKYREGRISEGRPFHFSISMCVQQQNWQGIGDFLRFALSKGANPVLQFAYQPGMSSLLNFPTKEIVSIAKHLDQLSQEFPKGLLHPILTPLTDAIAARRPPEGVRAP